MSFNPLFLGDPDDWCDICDTYLRPSGNPHDPLKACPFGPHDEPKAAEPVYGRCTGCGAIEARLNKATGTIDLSAIGEHHAYPTGYGCEFCA